jgi:hypothetical protein
MHGEGADPGTGSALISPMEPPLEARGLVRTYGRLTAHSALAQVISPIEIARWGPSLVLLALVAAGHWGTVLGPVVFSVADLGHLVLGSPLSRRPCGPAARARSRRRRPDRPGTDRGGRARAGGGAGGADRAPDRRVVRPVGMGAPGRRGREHRAVRGGHRRDLAESQAGPGAGVPGICGGCVTGSRGRGLARRPPAAPWRR